MNPKKCLLIYSLILIIPLNLFSQVAFEKKYGEFTYRKDFLSQANSMVMIGHSEPLSTSLTSPYTNICALVNEIDLTGVTVFAKYFVFQDPITSTYYDTKANSITKYGNEYYITGKVTNPNSGQEDVFVARLNTLTNTCIANRIDFNGSSFDEGIRILIYNGAIYVTGNTNYPIGSSFIWYPNGGNSLPTMGAFLMKMDLSLSISWSRVITFTGFTTGTVVSVEVKDFVSNPSRTSGPEITMIGNLRGDAMDQVHPTAFSGFNNSHTGSFLAKIDISGAQAILSEFYYLVSADLSGSSSLGESIFLEDVEYQIGGGSTGYNLAGKIETHNGTSWTGYCFYASHITQADLLAGSVTWEYGITNSNVTALLNSSAFNIVSSSISSIATKYKLIGTTYDNTKDIMLSSFDVTYNLTPPLGVTFYNTAIFDGGGDEEGRSLANGNFGFGYSNSFSSSSPVEEDYVSLFSPNFFSTCHVTQQTPSYFNVLTHWHPQTDCLHPNGLAHFYNTLVCLDFVGTNENQVDYFSWDPSSDNICTGAGSGGPDAGEATLGIQIPNVNSEGNNVSVYPNPVRDKLFITGFDKDYSYKLIDLTGRTILEGMGNFINVENFQNGVYILQIRGNSGITSHIRITKI